MKSKLIAATLLVVLPVAFILAHAQTQAAEMKLEAQLVWGTDDSKPPEGKNYKPVDPELKKRLKEHLPLRWNNYFEVRRKLFSVKAGEPSRKEEISDKCQLDVRNIDNTRLEVALIGKGKEVMRRTQTLPKNEILVLGGNAPNSTAWLVVVKRLE